MTVQNPAPGYPHLIPYLMIPNGRGAEAIAYYTQHFGFKERMRLPMQDKDGNPRIGHAELMVGDSMLMLSDFCDIPPIDHPIPAMAAIQPMLAIDGVDDVFARAIAAGATEVMPLEDMFYGDRAGKLRDPFGHVWYLTQHIRDVPESEMRAYMEKMQAG